MTVKVGFVSSDKRCSGLTIETKEVTRTYIVYERTETQTSSKNRFRTDEKVPFMFRGEVTLVSKRVSCFPFVYLKVIGSCGFCFHLGLFISGTKDGSSSSVTCPLFVYLDLLTL